MPPSQLSARDLSYLSSSLKKTLQNCADKFVYSTGLGIGDGRVDDDYPKIHVAGNLRDEEGDDANGERQTGDRVEMTIVCGDEENETREAREIDHLRMKRSGEPGRLLRPVLA
jgi:hypothetical protein